MKIYIAGPIRGFANANREAFTNAKVKLQAEGHQVFIPHDWDDVYYPSETPPIREALKADLDYICTYADAVALLPGWQNSIGANAERATAKALGLKIIEL